MATREAWETTNVIICGCGPTGALLSAYLGRASVHNVVLEREPDITTDPRGIALDEDGVRLLQGLGFYDQIFTDIGSCQLYRTAPQHWVGIDYLQAWENSISLAERKKVWLRSLSWLWITTQFVVCPI